MDIKKILAGYVTVIIVGLIYAVTIGKAQLMNLYYGITVWSSIFAIVWKILETKEKIKNNKLNNAIEIVNNFDNPELHKARDFTRLFKKEHDEQNLKRDELAQFIENELDKKKMDEYMERYNIKPDEGVRTLKSSLVYLFNYFQSVYAIINVDMADKDYVLRYLSNVYISLYDRFEVWLTDYLSCDKYQLEDLKKLQKMADDYINCHKN